MVKVYGYKKCSTVLKAIKYLKSKDLEVDFFDFVAEQLPKDTLVNLIETSHLDINEFFNKRGQVFKTLGLKVLLEKTTTDEKINLLLSDGKLIKRPIIRIDDKVFVGFNEKDIDSYLSSK